MRPDDTQPTQAQGGDNTAPPRTHDSHHQAVAQMTRDQIDKIYADQYNQQPPTGSVYDQTHTDRHQIQKKQWEHYHSSWQNYYQQYYGRHYNNAYQQAHQNLQQHVAQNTQADPSQHTQSNLIDKDEAIADLRGQLLDKVQTSAKKVRKSRHFVPAIAAFIVFVIFVGLQYNATIIAYAQAYITPGNIDPQNIIADPNLSLKVDSEPRLIIPKINVDIRVDYTAKSDYDSQMAAMRSSVAYFGIPGASSKPGQYGNVPISGHSSNDFTDSGDAKFVFARLEQLQKGDIFYLNYEGTRYTYAIAKTTVVMPNQVNALQTGDDKPYATLITCTPLGTAQKRLLVFAEQVSPAPSKATAPSSGSSSSSEATQMAGKSPTLLERAFGAR